MSDVTPTTAPEAAAPTVEEIAAAEEAAIAEDAMRAQQALVEAPNLPPVKEAPLADATSAPVIRDADGNEVCRLGTGESHVMAPGEWVDYDA